MKNETQFMNVLKSKIHERVNVDQTVKRQETLALNRNLSVLDIRQESMRQELNLAMDIKDEVRKKFLEKQIYESIFSHLKNVITNKNDLIDAMKDASD